MKTITLTPTSSQYAASHFVMSTLQLRYCNDNFEIISDHKITIAQNNQLITLNEQQYQIQIKTTKKYVKPNKLPWYKTILHHLGLQKIY